MCGGLSCYRLGGTESDSCAWTYVRVDTSPGLEGSKTHHPPTNQRFVGMIQPSREDTFHRVGQDQTLVRAVCGWRGGRKAHGGAEYIKDRKIVADSRLQSAAALRPVCTSVRGPNYLVTSRGWRRQVGNGPNGLIAFGLRLHLKRRGLGPPPPPFPSVLLLHPKEKQLQGARAPPFSGVGLRGWYFNYRAPSHQGLMGVGGG